MTPYYDDGRAVLYVGHVLDVLAGLEAGTVQTCITSPPYWGLRAYGTDPQVWSGEPSCSHSLEETAPGKVLTGGTGTASAKQVSNNGSQYGNAWAPGYERPFRTGDAYIHNREKAADVLGATCTRCGAWRGELGSEPTPDCLAWARGQEPCSVCFVCHLVTVFRAVRRVLHDTGTVFCNLGDSYSGSGKGPGNNGLGASTIGRAAVTSQQEQRQGFVNRLTKVGGLGPKQLMMMPARVALALQADGWVLRSAITWAKKSPMPESVRDRPTNATEMVYLLAKNPTYFWDAEAVRQRPAEYERLGGSAGVNGSLGPQATTPGASLHQMAETGANLRNFWLLGPEPFSGWTSTSRQVDVAADAIDGDTKRRASPNCPVHAGRAGQASSVGDGGRVDGLQSRTADTRSRPALAQPADYVTIALPLDGDSADESSGSLAPPHALSAIDHSTQSHRTDPVPVTTPACTASAETPADTADIAASYESPAPDDCDNPAESETADDRANIPACTCTYYKEVKESISHFATFPSKLVEPCVLAGTSARGQCPVCGAPWRRETEVDDPNGRLGKSWHDHVDDMIRGQRGVLGADGAPTRRTVGWSPTCTCDAGEPVPQICLDPFAGSGTTLAVARWHQRRAVGIELNPEYARLIEQRLAQGVLL